MPRMRNVLRPTLKSEQTDHYSPTLEALDNDIRNYRGKITALTVYPLKGVEGLSVSEAALSPIGLKTLGNFPDRAAMIVQWKEAQQQWERFSQRQEPGLARIRTSLPSEKILRLKGDHGEALELPPEYFERQKGEGTMAKMYEDTTVEGVLEEENEQLTQFVRAHLTTIAFYTREDLARIRILRSGYQKPRPVPMTHTGGPQAITHFADIGQHLLVNEATVSEYLNHHITGRPVGVPAFRPNVTVQWPPNLEDIVGSAVIQGEEDVTLHFGVLSTRCAVTAVDQGSGIKRTDKEPIQTLLNIRPRREGKPTMGINVAHHALEEHYKIIHVGDSVVPLTEKISVD